MTLKEESHIRRQEITITQIMRIAPKVVSPILLCWPTMSEADGGGIVVMVEPSC